MIVRDNLQQPFNSKTSRSLHEAEKALKGWKIAYEKKPNGTLYVPGDLNISCKEMTALPDLSSVTVGGDFYCARNELTSLKGAPDVIGAFNCSHNQLTSLKGAPRAVTDFYCHHNRLASLEHAPVTVSDEFYCYNNEITSLKGAPAAVGGVFWCFDNELTSLEDAPKIFIAMMSDFGNHASWADVPEDLRISPETKAQIEREKIQRQEQAETAIHDAVVLRAPLAVKRPLKLR